MKISKFWPEWRGRFWQRQGVIILPEDGDHPEAASTPWISPTKMHDDVLHWSYLMRHPRTQKALWITVDHHDIDVCAWDVFQLLLATDNTISVDVSETRSILRPLLHALGTAWPEFKRQLAAYTVNGVYSLERCFRIKVRVAHDMSNKIHTLL
jgi:hypothetical protein